jgi:hypothetical protein
MANGETYADALMRTLKGMGFVVTPTGIEKTLPQLLGKLMASDDPTSLALRFQPDFAICRQETGTSCVRVEAKAGVNVERFAWENYARMEANGESVLVIFRDFDNGWHRAGRLRFIDSRVVVARHEQPFPLDGEWICPRQAGHWENMRGFAGHASGTSYREVDPEGLLPFDSSRDGVLALMQCERLGLLGERGVPWQAFAEEIAALRTEVQTGTEAVNAVAYKTDRLSQTVQARLPIVRTDTVFRGKTKNTGDLFSELVAED